MSDNPTPIPVCFQFVTKGGAVIDSEPEDFPSLHDATKRAEEWMNLPAGRTITLITYEGFGAVIRTDETEHIAVMPASKMAELMAPDPTPVPHHQPETEGPITNE